MTIRELTAAEAAALLGVSVKTLQSYVRRGKLAARKTEPRRQLYPEDALLAIKADPPRPGNHTGRPRTKATPPAE